MHLHEGRTRDMNLKQGFHIEEPRVFVPWGISEGELKRLLGSRLRHVTNGYHTISCTSLGGMNHELGFHFEPHKDGTLHELEFFRRSYQDQEKSYNEFQHHFEAAFGPPTETKPEPEGFPSHTWRLRGATIKHYVFDRFGPEEHMRIQHQG